MPADQTGVNRGATAIAGAAAPQVFAAAAPSPQVAQQNGSWWGQLGRGIEQLGKNAGEAVSHILPGQPTVVPLPPDAPALPGDPHHIPPGEKFKYAGTHMGFDGNIVRNRYPLYNQVSPVARKGVDIHEGAHEKKLLNEYPHNFWGALRSTWDKRGNAWEAPAYQKQIDFYQDYLMTHPMTAPDWTDVFLTQRDAYDFLESIQKK